MAGQVGARARRRPALAQARVSAAPRPEAAPVTRTRLMLYLPSSRRATMPRCTSSGPSASRRVRALTNASGEREVVGHAAAAVELDGEVDDLLGHVRHGDLDPETSDSAFIGPPTSSFQAASRTSSRAWSMAMRASAMRSRLPPRLTSGLPNAVALEAAPAGQLEGQLGEPDQPHAVVDAAGTEPALGDREALARPGDDVGQRHPHVGERHLAVAERLVVDAHRAAAAARSSRRGCRAAPAPSSAGGAGRRRGR